MKDFKLTFEIAFALKNVHTPLRSDGNDEVLNWSEYHMFVHTPHRSDRNRFSFFSV